MSQWLWNLRLDLGQHLSSSPMRLTAFAPAQASEPAPERTSEKASEPAPEQTSEKASEPILYGPPRWARRSFTKGFAGADFALNPDGT